MRFPRHALLRARAPRPRIHGGLPSWRRVDQRSKSASFGTNSGLLIPTSNVGVTSTVKRTSRPALDACSNATRTSCRRFKTPSTADSPRASIRAFAGGFDGPALVLTLDIQILSRTKMRPGASTVKFVMERSLKTPTLRRTPPRVGAPTPVGVGSSIVRRPALIETPARPLSLRSPPPASRRRPGRCGRAAACEAPRSRGRCAGWSGSPVSAASPRSRRARRRD